MSLTPYTRYIFSPVSHSLVMAFLALNCGGCLCSDAQSSKKATAASAPDKAKKSEKEAFPPGVDGLLLGRIRDIAMSCDVDERESNVVCKNHRLEKLSDQFIKGEQLRSKAIDTLAYALTSADEKILTVTAELMHQAFRPPSNEKDAKPVSKQTALSLIKALDKLSDEQALDAAPAITYVAFQAGAEQELYQTVENHKYKRLVPRTYRYLLAAGGMRAWDKVQELAKQDRLEVATAALDAPNMLTERTAEDVTRICDWYKAMSSDSRQVIADRAGGYLITCGPTYVEPLLAADEAALTNKSITKIGVDRYQQMCVPTKEAVSPSPDQCARLKKLLVSVIADKRFDAVTRSMALGSLGSNFVEKDTLTLVKKHVSDRDPMVAAKAKEAASDVESALNKAKASEKTELKPASQGE